MSKNYAYNKIILDSLNKGFSVQQSLDALKKEFNISLFILNLNGQIECYSCIDELTRYFCNIYYNSAEAVFCDFSKEEHLLAALDTICAANKPLIIPALGSESSSDVKYHLHPIMLDNKVVKLLIIAFDSRYSDEDIHFFASPLSEIIGKKASSIGNVMSVSPNADNNSVEILLSRELLLYDSAYMPNWREEVFKKQFEEFRQRNTRAPRFAPPYAISAASIRPLPGGPRNDYTEALKAIKQEIPSSFLLVDQNTLLTFYYNYDNKLPDKLREISHAEGLQIAISDIFDDLEYRTAFKKQALAILDYGKWHKAKGHLYCFMDFFKELVMQFSIDEIGLSVLALSDVSRLADYDKANGTAYLETLEKYLECNNSYSKTAQELFIDRGTLKYRLNKISDIINTDFEDLKNSEVLSVSLYLYDKYRSSYGDAPPQ